MIRRPPRSTLFPTRRSSDLRKACGRMAASTAVSPCPGRARDRLRRSEEHTSELQSQSNLVCRLLLEKKKKKKQYKKCQSSDYKNQNHTHVRITQLIMWMCTD